MSDPEDSDVFTRGGRLWAVTGAVSLATLVGLLLPLDLTAASSWLALTPSPPRILAMEAALFLPFGFVELRLGRRLFESAPGWVLVGVALDGALLSLVGETAQVWVASRGSSLLHLVAHGMGATAGALAGEAIPQKRA